MMRLVFVAFALAIVSVADRDGRAETASGWEAAYDKAVEDVIALWDEADLVGLGERHGSKLDSDFRIRLVKHPDFGRKVDIIVVEFASATHQAILDRYVAGEDVPRSELVWVWRDTGSQVWDSPIYEAFLTAVREANLALPADDEVRVIAGDRPIDWAKIKSGKELVATSNRGSYPINVVDCEILSKGLKGLLIYGGLHLIRGSGESFIAPVEERYPGSARLVWAAPDPGPTLGKFAKAFGLGDNPQLVRTKDTEAENWGFHEFFFDTDLYKSLGLSVGDALDAIVYFGPVTDTIVHADPAVFEEPEYAARLKRRAVLMNEFVAHVDQHGFAGAQQWKRYCD